MGGTIPGLGTATASMDIRTIGDQNIETRETKSSTHGARLPFSGQIPRVENTGC